MAKITLMEFFSNHISEGPGDPTFKPAPAIDANAGIDAAAPPEMGMEDPAMTQDVAVQSASSLNFFSKNVQSAVSKYNLEGEGFDSTTLQGFAQGLDDLIFQMYQGVQEPATRQAFEADYQKLAADWSKDLTKLFDKVLKLKGHSAQF